MTDQLLATQHGLPMLGQLVTADFMVEGHFARHLKRMRALYARRRTALVEALAARFAERLTIDRQAGGLHVITRFADGGDDSDMVRRAAAAGLAPVALSTHYAGTDRQDGLLLGFTNIPEEQAEKSVAMLACALAV